MAVGISLPIERVGEFQSAFDEAVRTASPDAATEAAIEVAAWIPLDEVNERLLRELDRLHPFGQQNPEPIFGTRNVVFDLKPEVFRDQHFRFKLHTVTGRRISGVAWNMADRLPPASVPLDIAYQVEWNHFNGRSYVQMDLHDWRRSQL